MQVPSALGAEPAGQTQAICIRLSRISSNAWLVDTSVCEPTEPDRLHPCAIAPVIPDTAAIVNARKPLADDKYVPQPEDCLIEFVIIRPLASVERIEILTGRGGIWEKHALGWQHQHILQLMERCGIVGRRLKSPENVGHGGAGDPSPARKHTKNTLAQIHPPRPARNEFSSMKVNGANLIVEAAANKALESLGITLVGVGSIDRSPPARSTRNPSTGCQTLTRESLWPQ